MSTAPYLADTESVIAESHRQVIRVEATHPSFVGPLDLDLDADSSCSIDWDETRAPRVMASFSIKIPDAATIDALDPRTGVRVSFEAGYVRPGGIEDVQQIADLGIRTVTINRPDNTLDIECASDEALLIDASPAAVGSVTGATTAAAITTLISAGINPAPIVTASVTGAAVTVDPVTDRFDTAKDLADRLGAQLFDEGLRVWYIRPTPTVASTPDLTLKVGDAGTVLTGKSVLDRAGWFNYVFLRYVWKNAAGVDQTPINATAMLTDGPFAITGPSGKRIYSEDREVPTTQAEANSAAVSLLGRMQSRCRSYSLTAVAAYWLRPGMTVSVTLPGESAAMHLVQSVAFDPIAGTMSLETRLPETATVTTTTPPAGPATADPAPAAKTTKVSTWTASSSQAYTGSGAQNTGLGTDIAQGYYDTTYGNQRAIILFTGANSTGSETGVTITTALTGASISKVEFWAYANHTYGSSAAARVGKYGGSTIPTTFTADNAYVTVSGWSDNSGRWVTVTSPQMITELLSGFTRGITVGPGSGTDHLYYMKFNGASASSNKPLLKITYAK